MKITIIIIISAIVLYVIGLIFGGLIIGGIFNPPIKQEEMKRLFHEDYEDLADVANFLVTIDKDIYISDTIESGIISVSGENIEIKDEQIMHSINALISRGYEVITKNNNTICFQRWSDLDAGRGIAFSIDGTQPDLQFLTKLEKISENNWYYYEEDFNEWQNTFGQK